MNARQELSVLAILAFGFWPTAARAQTSESAMAQSLFDEAKALMASGRAAEACPKLEESQRLEARSGTLINLASCYERTERLASAWSKYLEAAAASAGSNPERESVARERAALLLPRLSRLTIAIAPALRGLAGIEVRVDGVVVGEPAWGVPFPADRGEHAVRVTAAGHVPFQARVSVQEEGKTTRVDVPALAREPETSAAGRTSPPAPSGAASGGLGAARMAALVSGGVGLAGVAVGSAFGLASKSSHDEAAKYCHGSSCTDQRGVTAGDAALRQGNVSTVAMLIGGVGLAAGVTLWLTAPPQNKPETRTQVGFGLGLVQLRRSF